MWSTNGAKHYIRQPSTRALRRDLLVRSKKRFLVHFLHFSVHLNDSEVTAKDEESYNEWLSHRQFLPMCDNENCHVIVSRKRLFPPFNIFFKVHRRDEFTDWPHRKALRAEASQCVQSKVTEASVYHAVCCLHNGHYLVNKTNGVKLRLSYWIVVFVIRISLKNERLSLHLITFAFGRLHFWNFLLFLRQNVHF